MTTATGRSARPGIGGGVPLEQGEDRLELDAQVLDRLGRQRATRLRLELPAAPILLDLLARALDRVFLRIEQVLHQHDQLDLAPLVHAVAGAVLGGVQEAKLAFPVPQHVRLQIGELTHFADRKELLHGMGGAHRQCSGLSSRSIKAKTGWLGDSWLKRTSATPSTSVAAYTRTNPVENTCCTRWATACSRAAATTAVGWRAYTSRANEGPDNTAIGVSFGRTSANTHEGVERRSGSRPLDTLTTKAPRPTLPRAWVMTWRTAWEGAADTTTSAPRTAAA